ncbi:MAG: class I SAM-dependent methyltransferase [bacterium]|jgi:SAM-dependent methyltransferase|nr:class I SAM-dependent methyltransferase [bacterium]
MNYDPVKGRLARLFLRRAWMKRLLFFLSRQFFLRELEVRRALRTLAGQGLRPRRILDAGTGFGQYVPALRQAFPQAEVVSVDLNPACVEALRDYCRDTRLGGVRAEEGDLLALRLESPVQLVLNVDVVEHIEDDRRVFRNFAAVLDEGGLLLLHTPAMEDGLDEDEVLRRTPTVGEHARMGYTRAMMRERLAQAGLEEVWLRSTYGRAGGLAWLLGVRAPMRLLGLGLWTLPLVLPWVLLVLLPVRLLNELDLRGMRQEGGCLLVLARKAAALA